MILKSLFFIFLLFESVLGESIQHYFEKVSGKSIVVFISGIKTLTEMECLLRCMDDSCTLAEYNKSSNLCRLGTGDELNLNQTSDSDVVIFKVLNMCGPPEIPNFGSIALSNVSTVCTFSCDPGYTLNGPQSLHCVQGSWNGTLPVCADIDECTSSPCLNNATCHNEINAYKCACVAGYTGIICEQDIDECTSSPCQNGATCVDLMNGYSCICAAGSSGLNCEEDYDECQSTPCQNGGSCVDMLNEYTCTCVSGYTGILCEQKINECMSTPCQNGGTCVDGINLYTCSCVAGFIGINCEQEINECSSSPCQHGATCVDMINSYACTCLSEYTGVHCEQDCFPGTPWEYIGTRNWTETGRTCQRWDSQTPQSHTCTDLQYFPETVLADARNYCRNPESSESNPWCYTMDPSERWEYCDIQAC